ncbi:hypothetical protein ACHAW5_007338 [Stephanodiscus triporus]|uniref:Uncharacterized protein n=1 Tax=Stephanodiscus triporus TaxID=2934178 RepID=A0ABD3MJT7_9STRA
MASSTLRKACMDAQRETCDNLKRNEKRKTVSERYRTNTTGPIVRGVSLDPTLLRTGKDTNTTQAGIHRTLRIQDLFAHIPIPHWARSALHQASYRGGEAECCHVKALLDGCQPRVELDLVRYTKSTLAIFVRSYVHLASITRGDIVSDRHCILLYNYRYLDETMASLSGLDDDRDGGGLGVPRLPGAERKINSANATLESGLPRVQQGPCADESRMMEKFHRCFSDILGPLYLKIIVFCLSA